MNRSRTLLTALAGFLVFVPITFVWHTVLFTPFYLGPDHAVKSADAFDPAWIVAANLVLCIGMAYFLPTKLGGNPPGAARNLGNIGISAADFTVEA